MADDLDPAETREWLESLDAVLAFDGPDRATFLLDELIGEAHHRRHPGQYFPAAALRRTRARHPRPGATSSL